jgi:hypothetical protein
MKVRVRLLNVRKPGFYVRFRARVVGSDYSAWPARHGNYDHAIEADIKAIAACSISGISTHHASAP